MLRSGYAIVARLCAVASLRAVILLCAGAACGGGLRKFADRPPMARDHGDFRPFSPKPKSHSTADIWDMVDNVALGPLGRLLAVDVAGESVNVNSMDEVPDSTWFTNRMSRADMSRDALLRGACKGQVIDTKGPWTVVGGKPDGKNPGFRITTPGGKRYLLKLAAGTVRGTAADVVGSLVYHAAGFNVPCNRIVYFDPAILRLASTATQTDFVGDKLPFTKDELSAAVRRSLRGPGGKVRAVASELLEGAPLGPFVDYGVRGDDANDVVPHEDRRELRGSYVLAAWLDHYDAREQNSLDMWIEVDKEKGAGYVRHHIIDFGDCFGSLSAWPRVSRRRGVAYEMDFSLMFTELITLGTLQHRWQDARISPAGKTLGYYDVHRFIPERWHTAYPYGPFTRVTERDAAWMARILARFSVGDIRALVGEARIADPVIRDELVRVLIGRRKRLLERYLVRLSPLADPHVRGDQLCMRDMAAVAGIRRSSILVCTRLPRGMGYHVVSMGAVRARPVKVHLIGRRVVGLER